MDADQHLDRPLLNGMTRRQILEKVMKDTTPGLRGDAKWASIRRLQRERARSKQGE